MLNKLGINKALWFLTALFSLIASAIGVFNLDIYSKIVTDDIVLGVLSQDLMTLVLSIIMLYLILVIKERDTVKQITVIGILGYLFYAYGIYVIERFYNELQLLYMAIFALSFYAIILGVANIRQEVIETVNVSKRIRYVAIGFSLFIPVLFYPLWISHLLPLMEAREKIEFLYSVYILDMVFVMPAFIIIAVMAIKKHGLGLLLIPTIFIKGFTLLFSVGFTGVLKLIHNQPADLGESIFYFALAAIFLILTLVYFRFLKVDSV